MPRDTILHITAAADFAVEPLPVSVRINGRAFPFTSYAEVSDAFCRARDASGTTAGCGTQETAAPDCELLDANGRALASVSYNGRIWAAADRRCLLDPYADA